MKTVAEKRLFWFLKDGTGFDLSNIAYLDMYVQQVLSRGRSCGFGISIILKIFVTTQEPGARIQEPE